MRVKRFSVQRWHRRVWGRYGAGAGVYGARGSQDTMSQSPSGPMIVSQQQGITIFSRVVCHGASSSGNVQFSIHIVSGG